MKNEAFFVIFILDGKDDNNERTTNIFTHIPDDALTIDDAIKMTFKIVSKKFPSSRVVASSVNTLTPAIFMIASDKNPRNDEKPTNKNIN